MIKIFGEQEKGKQPSESAEMITFVNYVRKNYPSTYGLVITHIRNEGKKTHNQAAKQKAEGLTKGASDIIIPFETPFVCEMKSKSKTSKVSEDQLNYLECVDRLGGFACITYGHKATIEAFEEWVNEYG